MAFALMILFPVTVFAQDNTPPVAVDDFYEVPEGGTLTVPAPGVLANDYDPDPADTLVLVEVDWPSPSPYSASISLAGANMGGFSLTPNPGVTGPVTFEYRVKDSRGAWSNWATVTVDVEGTSDLEIIKAVDTMYFGGDGPSVFGFHLTVINHGPDNATDVVVTDVLPVGLIGDDIHPDLSLSGQTMTWSVGELAVGEEKSIRIIVRPDGPGRWTNTATVAGAQVDPNMTNNSDSAELAIGSVNAVKFYDWNGNGVWDDDDFELDGWMFHVEAEYVGEGTKTYCWRDSGDRYLFLVGTDVSVTELQSTIGPWFPTTPTTQTVTVSLVEVPGSPGEYAPGEYELYFGNACLVTTGKSMGYWGNRNGEAEIRSDWASVQALLSSLNLVDEKGNPTDFDKDRTPRPLTRWVNVRGNAKNMSYMLSAQLAAMALNVHFDYVTEDALVYAECLVGLVDGVEFEDYGHVAMSGNTVAVEELIRFADYLLGKYPTSYAGDASRPLLECVKNLLDRACNGQNLHCPDGIYGDFTCPICHAG